MASFTLGLGRIAALIIALLSIPAVALASRIVYRDTTAEQAASAASTVVVATFLATDQQHGAVHRFRVERVLAGTTTAEIRVRPAHYTEWTTAMRFARTTGRRRSPLILRLPSPPAVPLRPAGRYCLLLDDHSVDPNALELTVDAGHLAEASCPRLAALAARSHRGDRSKN